MILLNISKDLHGVVYRLSEKRTEFVVSAEDESGRVEHIISKKDEDAMDKAWDKFIEIQKNGTSKDIKV